ncbi:MAG: M1 family metallopeptidase [Betaproteobacteria bacterium]|nr:M1 family metallopeptidase [Betaproteobacteria bacterium]
MTDWRGAGAVLMLAGTLIVVSAPTLATSPSLDLALVLDPGARTLAVTATLSADAGPEPMVWRLTPNAGVPAEQLTLPPSKNARTRSVRYRLKLDPFTALSHRDTLTETSATADIQGSFLPAASQWHPMPGSGPLRYTVSIDLPESQRGLVAGRLDSESIADGRYRARFTFDAPADGIDLMAGPYVIDERVIELDRPIRLRTYFHPAVQALAQGYLDSSADDLKRFSQRYGPYPYTEFSIVSSPTPTGLGMPTLTYLGVDVLKLPFIRHTSLGHEVLHNWWGNGVRVDYSGGNWCEGLTTYLADYANKERESAQAAQQMRLSWLRDLAALTGDATPRNFVGRTHASSQIVGYHKTAMLFHQTRRRLGDVRFDAALRQFYQTFLHREANWKDLQHAFESAAGESLEPVFSQTLDRADLPSVRLVNAAMTDASTLSITLAQGTPAFDLDVPITIDGGLGSQSTVLHFTTPIQTFQVSMPGGATAVTLDPHHQLLRRLDAAELPPILRQVMVAPAVHMVTLDDDAAIVAQAQTLAEQLLDHPPVPHAAPAQLLVGTHAALQQALGSGYPRAFKDRGHARVWAERDAAGGLRMVVSVRDLAALQTLTRPLPHYGGQSFVVFEGGKAVDRGVWPSHAPTLPVR